VSEFNNHELERIVERADDMASNRAQDGIKVVEYKADGVYLTVFPPQHGGKPIDPENVVKDLEDRKITEVEFSKVRQVAREMQGEPTWVASPQEEVVQDGYVKIEISKNMMEAYLTIYPPRGGKSVTREDVKKALVEKNIVYGIIDEIIERSLTLQMVSEPLVVAKGADPVDGENARIDYSFGSDLLKGKPTEMINGSVDFYNLHLIQNVQPGEILANKVMATPGTPGHTVNGDELPSKPGKDVQIGIGKNVELIDDNTTAVASVRGHAILAGNKISVSNVYEVNGDVDFNTGNIEFNGSVIVKGSVREGFRVAAEGDVEIQNTIADGIVICSGNLKVQNGIVGKKSRISAGGNIVTKFIENSSVEAGGEIVVGEAIMHSRVSSKKSVTVGGKGVIVGGLIRAAEEITCNIAGSHLATITEMEAGISPELRQEHNRMTKEKQAKEIDLDKADKAIKLLKHIKDTTGDLSQDKIAILVRVSRAHAQLVQEITELQTELENTEFQLQQSERGKIKVQGIIHPGVRVSIGSAYMQIQDDYSFACLTKVGPDIKINPYS
jgi:uncharacterized protein (DUF342 family)